MSTINFHTISIKNFLSYGDNPIVFQLDRSPTTLMQANSGVGKSTIIDALTFVLFGKSFRSIKKQSLINTINQRDSVVEITFSKGNNEYKIIRGQKPNRLEVFCNNKELNETAAVSDMQHYIETQVLGFDYSTFSRVCVMSSMNYTPFMQLSASDRRSFVETMLGLTVFSEMVKEHKINVIAARDHQSAIESEISKTEIQIQEKTDFLKYVSSNVNKELAENKSNLATMVDEVQSLSASVEKLTADIESKKEYPELESNIQDLTAQDSDVSKQVHLIEHELKTIKKDTDYLAHNDVCMTCKQSITEKYKSKMLSEFEAKALNLKNSLSDISSHLNTIRENLSQLKSEHKVKVLERSNIEQQKNIQETLRKKLVQDSKALLKKIEELKSKTSVDTKSVIKDIELLKFKRQQLKIDFEENKTILDSYQITTELLKDTGIKSDIIKQYVPLLVAYTNQYLEKMNLPVKFNMDENFQESIQSRYMNEFTYNNLSAGERNKLDFSIAMSWRHVARLKGSVDTNLLILDELLDANLDAAGTLLAFDIINEISQDNVHVFIVSHKVNLEENVRSVIRLRKDNGFTKIE